MKTLIVKRTKLYEAWENADVQVAIGFCLASDWFRGWCEIFINKRRANSMERL